MLEKEELLLQIESYNPHVDKALIAKAYDFGRLRHEGQTRQSGEPYFTHPIQVALILSELKMDTASVVAALLHDTVEDTNTSLAEIESNFGHDVAKITDGITKLAKIKFKNAQENQAENFRKLVLAMSDDIRVLLVKLCDRLHNMRTINFLPKEEKRKRIALETIEIYAPLAERIGIHRIKEELEDICFEVLNHEARQSIITRLNYLRAEGGEEIVKNIVGELKLKVKEAEIKAEVYGREKTKYSIWRKMQRKNISFEQLSDIMAFRIIVDNIEECYHVLGVIHGLYPTVPGRFKDYISLPKPNGYRSLHTTVIGPENHRIEIQIRTRDMHEESELGVAAHWLYKQDDSKQADAKQYRWLRELMDVLEEAQKPEEVLENTRLELYQDQVFCFTPNGDLIALPKGSTPIDFAYSVHSKLGDCTVGAKVNRRIVPLNTQLINGDQVEIITAKNQNPSPNWERFVVTAKAKSRIRRFVRQKEQEEYKNLGKAMLQKTFKQEGMELHDRIFTQDFCRKFNMENYEMVLVGVGSGNISAKDVFYAAHPECKAKEMEVVTAEDIIAGRDASNKKPAGDTKKKTGKHQPMPIKGLIPGMAVHFARCCHPLPGDKIVGIVTTGKGVTIHTVDCETLEAFADTPERWLDISWGDAEDNPEVHVGRLLVTLANTPGALAELSTIIGKGGGNITNLKITNRALDFWELIVDVYVKDSRHLEDITASLRASQEIIAVKRSKNK